jgi:hypothetical protein
LCSFIYFVVFQQSIRELSILVLKEIIKNQKQTYFDTNEYKTIIYALLESSLDSAREVCQAAVETLDQLVLVVDPQIGVDVSDINITF